MSNKTENTIDIKKNFKRQSSSVLLEEYKKAELEKLKEYKGISLKDRIKGFFSGLSLFKIEMGIFHRGTN